MRGRALSCVVHGGEPCTSGAEVINRELGAPSPALKNDEEAYSDAGNKQDGNEREKYVEAKDQPLTQGRAGNL